MTAPGISMAQQSHCLFRSSPAHLRGFALPAMTVCLRYLHEGGCDHSLISIITSRLPMTVCPLHKIVKVMLVHDCSQHGKLTQYKRIAASSLTGKAFRGEDIFFQVFIGTQSSSDAYRCCGVIWASLTGTQEHARLGCLSPGHGCFLGNGSPHHCP